MTRAHEGIRNSFGGVDGIDEFREVCLAIFLAAD